MLLLCLPWVFGSLAHAETNNKNRLTPNGTVVSTGLLTPTPKEEMRVINSYANRLISSYDVNFKDTEQAQMESSVSLWEHAIKDMDFVVPKHTTRNSKYTQYVIKHKQAFEKHLELGHLYLFYIINELRVRNMPLELAVIPIIESNFNPHAVSPTGAIGIWQFTRGTGKVFNLTADRNYDLRKDPIASTNAALDYFARLYKMFGDWSLAIAAYNVGPGTVQKAINRNRAQGKPVDLWSLHIPRAGVEYVNKLYAYTDILRNAEKYHIEFPDMPFKPVFKKVALNGQNLQELAKHSGVSVERLQKLNPGFANTHVTTTKTKFAIVPIQDNDLREFYVMRRPDDPTIAHNLPKTRVTE